MSNSYGNNQLIYSNPITFQGHPVYENYEGLLYYIDDYGHLQYLYFNNGYLVPYNYEDGYFNNGYQNNNALVVPNNNGYQNNNALVVPKNNGSNNRYQNNNRHQNNNKYQNNNRNNKNRGNNTYNYTNITYNYQLPEPTAPNEPVQVAPPKPMALPKPLTFLQKTVNFGAAVLNNNWEPYPSTK